MNYYRTLVYELRMQSLPEADVTTALREARDLDRGSDRTPEELFGFGAAVLAVALANVAHILVDRRLPKGFQRSPE